MTDAVAISKEVEAALRKHGTPCIFRIRLKSSLAMKFDKLIYSYSDT